MTSTRIHPRPRPRRGSVIVIVVWAIAIAAVVTLGLQLVSYRQATLGKEALGRVQARWAARAGIEETISIMAYHTESPDTNDAFRLVRDMEDASYGELQTGSWDIRHFADGQEWAGPMDEHSKVNVNAVSSALLMNIPDMTLDVADAIVDWRDDNDDVEGQGAEKEYYANLAFSYQPRNGAFRSIAELELVAGAWPEYVRGEDWNLNGRLDPNEDDGSASFPPDKADGVLEAGWSQYLTAYSRSGGTGSDGQPKLNLKDAESEEVQTLLGVDPAQADALLAFAKQDNASLGQLLIQDLGSLPGVASSGAGNAGRGGGGGQLGAAGGTGAAQIQPLTTEELRTVFQECTLLEDGRPGPGKINVNTVSAEVLRDVLGFDPSVADSIVRLREGKPEGLTSIVDLLELEDLAPQELAAVADLMDTTSNVYSITSRGRSWGSGTEVEIFVVVDRSSLPVKILEYREQ